MSDLNQLIRNTQSLSDLPKLEKEIIHFWEREDIFAKSLKNRKGKDKFVFYDGPPFANGLPHYGHILAMSIKDLFVRYKTMRGYLVPRRNGWDCHGLPVEYQIEKDLGIAGKKQIEEYGIDKFNKHARDSVFKYVDEWTGLMKRVGRWLDFDNNYATLEKSYIESVWWVFAELWQKGLVYEGYTNQPYCTRCGTSLSNFETNQGYKDNVKDPSLYVKFKIKNKEGQYLLAWTTTPWTLPANLALAVRDDIKYGLYKINNEQIWVAEELFSKITGEKSKPVKSCLGADLCGTHYEPLYPISKNPLNKLDNLDKAYRVYSADFVSTEEGTGIVHVAPAYGEDDMALGKKYHLPLVFSAGYDGKMLTDIGRGQYIKEGNKVIISDLKKRELLFREGVVRHTYPFCWRCDNPLIYIATSSWFVAVSKIKERLVALNAKINWRPQYIKEGRFGNWLEGARDWNIARQRFWGAPIPIWQCKKCGEKKVVSSFAQLNLPKNFDPHRPQIDDVTLVCKCGATMKRIPEVFDCWFESGCMPYGQWHYPFENKEVFNENFPADFIAEGIDQTRGWFYTMHVISSAVMEEPSFYNVVVNGLVLSEDGQKLSKKLRNYPEPSEVFDKIGADSLRIYLYTATQIGEDYRFSNNLVLQEARKTVFPLWNTLLYWCKFLKTDEGKVTEEGKLLDKWIKNRINLYEGEIRGFLDAYDLTRGARKVEDLITDISQWYLRLSRKRTDKEFRESLTVVLRKTAIIIAPFMPFMAEIIYQLLRGKDDPQSVHLLDWEEAKEIDHSLIEEMEKVRALTELGRNIRAFNKIKVRQPLGRLNYKLSSQDRLSTAVEKILLQELNVLAVSRKSEKGWLVAEGGGNKVYIDSTLTEALKEEGDFREISRAIQDLRKKAGLLPGAQASVVLCSAVDLTRHIKKLSLQTNSTVSYTKKGGAGREVAHIKLHGGEAVIYLQ